MPAKIFKDPNSLSNTDLFQINHISLNWSIDFNQKLIKGFCNISFELCSIPATSNDTIVKNLYSNLVEISTKINITILS